MLAATIVAAPLATDRSSAQAGDPVLAAAGDIACQAGDVKDLCKQAETAELIERMHPDAVAPLGDNQYEWGELSEFEGPGAYGETWGRFNSIAHPVPGNHEYDSAHEPKAEGYFEYFGPTIAGTAAGGGYYSYNLGAWHIIALNSNCSDSGCGNSEAGAVSSAELSWLGGDLASHTNECILAYWHHPAFTSGGSSVGDSPGVLGLWNLLYAAHADVVLNGHDHKYERFAQQDPSENVTSAGIREFVVGTGGQTLFEAGAGAPNLERLDANHFGVLFLTLHAYGYEWAFRATDGTTIDSGTTPCHAQPPPSSPPPPPPPPPAPQSTKLERLRFTAHVAHVVHRRVLKRGLPVHISCSKTCRIKSVTVLVRRGGRTVKTIHYRYAGQASTHEGVLHLQLKGIRPGVHLILTLVAVSTTGERSSAKTTTLLAR